MLFFVSGIHGCALARFLIMGFVQNYTSLSAKSRNCVGMSFLVVYLFIGFFVCLLLLFTPHFSFHSYIPPKMGVCNMYMVLLSLVMSLQARREAYQQEKQKWQREKDESVLHARAQPITTEALAELSAQRQQRTARFLAHLHEAQMEHIRQLATNVPAPQ